MLRRRAITPALAVLAALALAACTPSGGTATPTPTELTEKQAYAAAEEAFRAYIDALNQIDVSNPSTFEPAFALTTGRQNAFDRKQYSAWHADGWSQVGEFRAALLEPASISDDHLSVQLASCLDVSDVDIVNADGTSMVDQDRVDVQTLLVEVDRVSDKWVVEVLSPREGDPPCS